MIRVACCALLLVLGGCPGERLQSLGSDLQVSADQLDFSPAWVGHPSRARLEIQNGSRAGRPLEMEVPPPFRLLQAPDRVPGGGTVTVLLELLAEEAGPHGGVLQVRSEGLVFQVQLQGVATLPPECGGDTCAPAVFDPALGACVVQPAPEGTGCAAPCVESGACRGGVCVGTARSCDDGNACTTDACHPTQGCVHVDRTASCPAPASPCQVAVCHPSTGCGVAEAQDGTSCGAFSCDTAEVCIAGACQEVPVPEGATCAPASACQGKGVCVEQACVLPAPTALSPAWSYQAPNGVQVHFPGVADAQGALYWLECAESCALVSVTRDGFLRYRTPLPGPPLPISHSERRLLLAGGTVVATPGLDWLVGVRASDGALLWTRDLRPLGDPAGDLVRVRALTAGQSGGLFLLLTSQGAQGPPENRLPDRLLALDDAGLPLWSRTLDVADGLVLDEAGHLYLRSYSAVSGAPPPELASFTAAGVERFRAQTFGGAPLAAYADRLVQLGGVLVSTANGTAAPLAVLPGGYGGSLGREPLLTVGGSGYLMAESDGCLAFADEPSHPQLVRFDAVKGEVLWVHPLTSAVGFGQAGQPVLTAAGSVLLTWRSPDSASWWLNEVDAQGQTRFSCAMPDDSWWSDAAVLHQGRWFSMRIDHGLTDSHQVVAFDVPGVAAAASGWTAQGGSPRGSGRPLP